MDRIQTLGNSYIQKAYKEVHMGTVIVETFISRPPEEVFAFLRDYSNEAKWQSAHVSQSIVEPPGPAAVGTRVHKVRRTPGGEQRFTIQITEMDESARRWTDVTMTGLFRGTKGMWQVLPEGDGSRVKLTAEMHAVGLGKLLLPIIDSSARKDLQVEFDNLKIMLESGKQ
jgi:carbon monoxide dehydrogenase subunit G